MNKATIIKNKNEPAKAEISSMEQILRIMYLEDNTTEMEEYLDRLKKSVEQLKRFCE